MTTAQSVQNSMDQMGRKMLQGKNSRHSVWEESNEDSVEFYTMF